jgi:penicillin-binding protein 1A
VIDRMVDQGYLSRADAERAKARPLSLAPPLSVRGGFHRRGVQVGWFARHAEQEANAASPEHSGTRTLLTTLDSGLQHAAERHLGDALRRNPSVEEGAIVVMRPGGAILAMVGGRDFRQTEWNHATQARRQPGSVAKLFVYLAALERGMAPEHRVSDSHLTIGGRAVRNFDGRYFGDIAMRSALARSSNTAAVRLASSHLVEVRDVARRLGVTDDLAGEAGDLALGTYGATLLELTAAYGALANGGRRVVPYCVEEIRGNDGDRLYTRVARRSQPVIRPQHVREMRRMLAAVIRSGTGRAADPGVWAAGKTGTTTGNRDAWFIGFTDRLVAGVWLGNTSAAPMQGVTGGGLPARIWRAVIADAMRT